MPTSTAGSLISVVMALLVALCTSEVLHAGAVTFEERCPTIKEGFLGNATTLAVAFVVALLSAVLSQLAQDAKFLFHLPMIAVPHLLYFAAAEATRGAGFGEAISSGARLAVKNFGTVVVTALLAIAICVTLVIPVLAVTVIPIVQLLVLGVHQRVTGDELVEPAAV